MASFNFEVVKEHLATEQILAFTLKLLNLKKFMLAIIVRFLKVKFSFHHFIMYYLIIKKAINL